MALKVEGVVDGSVHAEEPLGGLSRLEPLHHALSSSHRLMRILGAIVLPEPLFMRAGQPQTPERRGVGMQLVGHQQLRDEALLLEQLAHQPQRCSGIAPALNQHVEDLALVIDGPPQVHPFAGDPTTISSRYHRLLGRGRRRRSRRAITGPNFNTQLRTVS